jgi:hypothetical protein
MKYIIARFLFFVCVFEISAMVRYWRMTSHGSINIFLNRLVFCYKPATQMNIQGCFYGG